MYATREKDQPLRKGGLGHALCGRRIRLSPAPFSGQVERDHCAFAADCAHRRHVIATGHRVQAVHGVSADDPSPLDQLFIGDRIEHGEGRGASDRIAGEGASKSPRVGGVHDVGASNYTLGVPFGAIVGCALGRWEYLDAAANPFVRMFNAIPAIALVPFFLLWFGVTEVSRYALLFYTVSLTVLLSARQGVRSVPPPSLEGCGHSRSDRRRSISAGSCAIVRALDHRRHPDRDRTSRHGCCRSRDAWR